MAKTNPLKSLASQVAESMDKPPERTPAPPPAPSKFPDEWAMVTTKLPRPTGSKKSREGKKFLGLYVAPCRHEEIKQAALDEGIQVQELLMRALDDWMDRYGRDAMETVATRRARRSKRVS